MAMHGTDLALMVLLVVAGCAASYGLLVRKLGQIVTERDLKIADQLGVLDTAVQTIETRLAEYRAAGATAANHAVPLVVRHDEVRSDSGSIAGDIKAVVAAAAGSVLRKNIAIKSIRAVPTPWSQQGRVIVLGSHNLRVRQ